MGSTSNRSKSSHIIITGGNTTTTTTSTNATAAAANYTATTTAANSKDCYISNISSMSLGIFLFVVTAILKILLIPSYRSTDFDVHRNWLAVTRNLPISKWYFDDVNGTTVHTLDYPPSFAFFEYFLSNNFITEYLIHSGLVNDRCFQLLGDHDNVVGMDCVIFQRLTVMLAELVYFVGILAVCHVLMWTKRCDDDDDIPQKRKRHHASTDSTTRNTSMDISFSCHPQEARKKRNVILILSFCNAGLILLDHIHFQYNGMLIGILLLSISCMLKSMMTVKTYDRNKLQQESNTTKNTTVPGTTFATGFDSSVSRLEMLGSILFAWLVTFKHLYLTLGPVYFSYLLCRVCHAPYASSTTITSHGGWRRGLLVKVERLIVLGSTVLLTLMLPFVPFIMFNHWKEQMTQILSRLFPFHQRGLCHDYWAGNVWALYMCAEKIYNFVWKNIYKKHTTSIISGTIIPPDIFPEISPKTAAILLFLAMVPAMVCSWKIAKVDPYKSNLKMIQQRQEAFLYCIVYAALSSFMLSYHVHEKAIMTAIIPMIFISTMNKQGARLFFRMATLGQFGLLPLLHKPTELLLKIFLNFSYLSLSVYVLETIHDDMDGKMLSSTETTTRSCCICQGGMLKTIDKIGLIILILILLYSECCHWIIFGHDMMQFLPLLMISVFCAVGLVWCWIQSGIIMFRLSNKLTSSFIH